MLLLTGEGGHDSPYSVIRSLAPAELLTCPFPVPLELWRGTTDLVKLPTTGLQARNNFRIARHPTQPVPTKPPIAVTHRSGFQDRRRSFSTLRLTQVQSEAYEGKRQHPCGCSGRIIERRKLLIRLRLVIPDTLMVVLYHSSVGRFGEKLGQLFRGAWLA
jgi:hypothetical protein